MRPSSNLPFAEDYDVLAVGDIYMVRTVEINQANRYCYPRRRMPVIGHLAADDPQLYLSMDGIQARDQRHIHIDQRFVDLRAEGFGMIIVVASEALLSPNVEYESMACVRPTSPVLFDDGDPLNHRAFNTQKIEDLLVASGRTYAKNGLCPHKGTPLRSGACQLSDGRTAWVCPNHGVTFDACTGEMIPRKVVAQLMKTA